MTEPPDKQTFDEFQDYLDTDLESEAREDGDNEQADKIRENRLRRMADRQGLKLLKSRSRDPRAIDYGRFMIADKFRNVAVAGELRSPRALSLDDVEKYLTED